MEPTIDIEYDRFNMVSKARMRAVSPRPLAEIARGADPQLWCTSPYFAESHQTVRVGGDWVPHPHPRPPGNSWRGHLYEHFGWKLGPLQVCRFLNILTIDYQVSTRALNLQYSLHRPLDGKAWFSPSRLGVDVDRGYMTARRTPGGTLFELVKIIRFVELDARACAGPGNGPTSDLSTAAHPKRCATGSSRCAARG